MKTRLLIILGIVAIISIGSFVIIFQTQLIDIAPCFDKEQNRHVPCTPEKSIQFYEYKGEEWMKAKKKEMIETMRNNTFHEWIDQTKDDHSHWNVYQYYSYAGDLAKYTSDLEGLDSGWITEEDYCGEWCDQNELYELGCDQPILAHITKYSNLFNEEFDGIYFQEGIGLPDSISVEKFEECVDFIYEKRIGMELTSGKTVTGSYELEDPLCIGGRGYIVNENCEIIGKYDPATGLPIVENKEQCDMLGGDWNEPQNICDSKYGGK